MHSQSFSWNRDTTQDSLNSLLDTLAEEFPFSSNGGTLALEFVSQAALGSLRVTNSASGVRIEYGSIRTAARGIAHALAGTTANETSTFETMGIMLDCSRHAVMTVPYVKRWMRRLALMGYNMLMLYTEDTYQLPGEPYFGYMRGGYSADEIREIDGYAASLGIEVVACIQTLGHSEQILKWGAYSAIRDTEHVLLAGEEKTYALIEKMLDFWTDNLGTRRIHIGMDEAFNLGRGKFMDQHGCEPAYDIFTQHLTRVSKLCVSRALHPLIWSDMFFTMGSATHDYYDRSGVIPQVVAEKIPKAVRLVYWDYSSTDEEFYGEWIRRHRALGSEPVMASGIWTCARFWYDHPKTKAAVDPCVNACRKEGVKEIIFTMWGDGISYCEFDSAFAGMAYAADRCFGGEGESAKLTPLLAAIGCGDYEAILIGSELQGPAEGALPALNASTIVWDDPLLGIGWQGWKAAGDDFWPGVIARLRSVRERVSPHKESLEVPDYGYLWALSDLMIRKLEFRHAFVEAYARRDRKELLRLRDQVIPEILGALEALQTAFRRQWLRRNKPFGMEATQIRLGAGTTRFRETQQRIGELLDGKIDAIAELDAQPEGLGLNPVEYFVWLSTGSVRL